MHPETRNKIVVEIENRLFKDGSLCYYQVFVDEQNLDEENYAYYWEILFEDLVNVNATISNGTTFESAGDTIELDSVSG